jgi:hypothetical protein
VTRTAAKRAAHGRLVPLRQVTRRQARGGKTNANARTAIGRVSGTSTSCDRGRPTRPLGGTWTAGVPGNTVRCREIPTAYGRRQRCSARLNAVTSPNSASASTAVICRPAARARRINVSA